MLLTKNIVNLKFNFVKAIIINPISLYGQSKDKYMVDITFKDGIGKSFIGELANFFDVEELHDWGEISVKINNKTGKGEFKSIVFSYGVNLMRFDVTFREDVAFTFKYGKMAPLDFIFLTTGAVGLVQAEKEKVELKSYQNTIVYSAPHSQNTFYFSAGEPIRMNLIRINAEEYIQKKNNNIEYLQADLQNVFLHKTPDSFYNHFGNFNLKIADQIQQLNSVPHDGMVRTLIIEGNMNIILGLQLLEHENFVNNIWLPESISQKDIEKIQDATKFIQETISDSISVKNIARKVDLSPSKLQMGFKLLFSQTVSEYIKELKLLKARDLLKNTELSVSEVVYSIGYKNRSYFSRIFSERYGILPTEYRKKLK